MGTTVGPNVRDLSGGDLGIAGTQVARWIARSAKSRARGECHPAARNEIRSLAEATSRSAHSRPIPYSRITNQHQRFVDFILAGSASDHGGNE